MQYPIQHAAPSFQGKPPAELPHNLITPPPEVRQMVEEQRIKHAITSESYLLWMLNNWTVAWYFEDLGHEVIYRETPDGPVVVAVGYDEVFEFRERTPLEEQLKHKGFLDYSDFS